MVVLASIKQHGSSYVRENSRRFFAVLAVAAPFLGGCMTTSSRPSDVTQEQVALNPFDTAASRPEILLSARLDGTLGSNGRCVTIGTANGSVTPLWPEGTEVRREANRTLLVLPDGRGTAEFGQRVRLGGGAFGPADRNRLAEPARSACPEVYFAVSNVAE